MLQVLGNWITLFRCMRLYLTYIPEGYTLFSLMRHFLREEGVYIRDK